MENPSWFTLTDDGAILCVGATPNAKKNAIEGIRSRADGTGALQVRVTAPPDKGKANAAIIALLAKALKLPKSAFSIVSGETARIKTIAIRSDAPTLPEALEALATPPQ